MIPNWRQLEHILSSLNECYSTTHFAVQYAWRSGAAGRHGIHDLSLVEAYAASLEAAWDFLAIQRPDLLQHLPAKIRVYVFDTPFAAMLDVFGLAPFVIILPVRHRLARWSEVLERAQAEAAHEVMHLFNAVRRGPASFPSRAWQWLDEGLAICAEGWVWPGNIDHQRFLLDWRDFPEIPLDAERARYQTQMFVQYLAQRFGQNWLFDLWDHSSEDTPIEAMKDRLPTGLSWETLFADYMCEAYSLCEPNGHLYAPKIGKRFDVRLLTANVTLQLKSVWCESFTLDHLAGRYFRFELPASATQMQVRLQEDVQENGCLTAVLWQTGATSIPLLPDGNGFLIVKLPVSAVTEAVILVVTNVGTKIKRPKPDVLHNDSRRFSLEVAVS